MLNRLRISPILFFPALIIVGVTLWGWSTRYTLHAFSLDHPAFYTAILIATTLLCVASGLILLIESSGLRRTWLSRTASLTGMQDLNPPGLVPSLLRLLPDPFEMISEPVFRTRLGKALEQEWIEADLGSKTSRYLLLLLTFAGVGFLIGMRVGGWLLAAALTLSSPLLPRTIVRNRAQRFQSRFTEQLPQALDGLASGLSAGLSFEGAIDYVHSELAEPARTAFARLSTRLALGNSVRDALFQLQDEADEEGLRLVIDGLILQRQFGGDLIQMLEETAALLRERIELEQEVRAITTQGRLSGIIIAVLVPVSAGFLLAFNPRYIDVLFDNLIGQALVVLALALQLIGWAIISRLVRLKY